MTIAKAVVVSCVLFLTMACVAMSCQEDKMLALNLFHEARGQGEDGMLMVADVTINRVEDDQFPDDICSVITQPGQFVWVSRVGTGTPKYEQETWKQALSLSREIIAGDKELPDTGALYFASSNSKFHSSRSFVTKVGSHKFYR